MFILPLTISLVLMLSTIYFFGWGFDIPGHFIWMRFSGYLNDEILSQPYVSTALIICITLPLMLTCWYAAYRMECDLQYFFDWLVRALARTQLRPFHIQCQGEDWGRPASLPMDNEGFQD